MAEVERPAAVGVSPEYRYGNGDRAQFTNLVYRLQYRSGDAEVGDDESIATAWFSAKNLPPMANHFVRRVQQALRESADAVIGR